MKLSNRIESYQEASNYKIINKIPVIISVNGRAFAKTTSLLDKPFCTKFSECMMSTLLRLCSEIEGAVFGYCFNDEMIIISRNDQSPETLPWFDNKIQKISSVASSIATLHFQSCVNAINLDLTNDPIFTTQIFGVPNIAEAINTIIYKQQNNFHHSVQSACFYELLKKYDKNTIKEMLVGLTIDEKIDLLYQECNVTFNEYPILFRRGAACYKVPQLSDNTSTNKFKWIINPSVPIFTKDQSFISNILKNGMDIFRKDNL